MKRSQVIFILLIFAVCVVTKVISMQTGHQFTAEQGIICHLHEKGGREDLRLDVTGACATCHPALKDYKSHPTDIIPKMHIPGDMLLLDGRFTCVSCHDAHAQGGEGANQPYFLRRNVSGKPFCLICHSVDDEGHLFIGVTHEGQFQVTDFHSRVDPTTLICLECHVDRIDSLDKGLGAGTWSHFSGRLEHPLGVSYQDAYLRRPVAYIPPASLNDEIKLFDGKIGCGTCHNRYSRYSFMLVMSNEGSQLCFSCHIK